LESRSPCFFLIFHRLSGPITSQATSDFQDSVLQGIMKPMKSLLNNLMLLGILLIVVGYATGSELETGTALAGYARVSTCDSCPSWKKGKHLVLTNSEGQKVKSWWLGWGKKNEKVIAHDDPEIVDMIKSLKSSGTGDGTALKKSLENQKVYRRVSNHQEAKFPLPSSSKSDLSSAALLVTRYRLYLDFCEFAVYECGDSLMKTLSENDQVDVLDVHGDVIWSMNKKKDTSYSPSAAWISQGASVVGLQHFKSGGFYVQLYDSVGKPTYRLPNSNWSKYAIRRGGSTTLTRSGEYFVLGVTVRKGRKRGTFVLVTKNGRWKYFDEELEAHEAVRRFVYDSGQINHGVDKLTFEEVKSKP